MGGSATPPPGSEIWLLEFWTQTIFPGGVPEFNEFSWWGGTGKEEKSHHF